MTLSLYEQAERFLIDAFTKAGKPTDVQHGQRTAYWIREFYPAADEALLVAGLLHDIERAFYGDWKKGSDDPAALRKHQDLSAEEAMKFLRGISVSEAIIERVGNLIRYHETGGDDDQNVLCDADCLAYFEEKASRWAKRSVEEGSQVEMRRRLEYYFSRFKSPRARQLAQPYFEEAINLLVIE